MYYSKINSEDLRTYKISPSCVNLKFLFCLDGIAIDWIKKNKWRLEGAKSIGFVSNISTNLKSVNGNIVKERTSVHGLVINLDEDIVNKERALSNENQKELLVQSLGSVLGNWETCSV